MLRGKTPIVALAMRAGATGARACVVLPLGWPESGAALRWHYTDGNHTETGQASALADVPARVRQLRVTVWTPGTESLLTRARVPTRSRAKILQALPFALEDQLLGDPEAMHFAYAPATDGELAVAVTARARVEAWREAFAQAQWRVAALCPITLSLPLHENAWSVGVDEQEILLRTGPYAGAAMPRQDGVPPLARAMLDEARAADTAPAVLTIHAPAADALARSWSDALALPVNAGEAQAWRPLNAAAPFDLLQGEADTLSHWRALGRRYLPALALFGALIVAGFFVNAWRWYRLSSEDALQRKEMVALLKRAFPDTRAISDDPALQMRRDLAVLRARSGAPSDNDFLALLARAAPRLQGAGATLQGVQYTEHALTLEIQIKDFQALEGFKNALAGAGLKAEVASSTSQAGAITAHVRVTAAT